MRASRHFATLSGNRDTDTSLTAVTIIIFGFYKLANKLCLKLSILSNRQKIVYRKISSLLKNNNYEYGISYGGAERLKNSSFN